MERRVLLAIFLCFLVLYLWNAFVVKPVPKRPATTGTSAGAPAGEAPLQPEAAPNPASPSPGLPSAAVTPPPNVALGDQTERETRVETHDVIAVFTNKGARLKSWRLKHYSDQEGQPQELVVHEPSQPLPFTVHVADEQTNAILDNALYSVTATPPDGSPEAASQPTHLRFEYSAGAGGLSVVKEVDLAPNGYVINFGASIRAPARAGESEAPAGSTLPYTILWGPAVGDIAENSRYVKKAEGLFFQNGKVKRLAPKDFASQPTSEGDFRYVGVDDNYFMVAALFTGPIKVTYQPVSIPPPANSKDPARELVSFAAGPRTSAEPIKFFAGPKDFDVLKAIDPDVVSAIDFGMFRVIVVPLLSSLKGINSYVHNYGFSIILLTVIINAIMFPLRHKSVVSMRKMQEIQPQVKAIQDRYAKLKATDPAKSKMNQELMALYRERGVNPASGCFPMLLTMPVLIAFYALLSTAIELRGAPFLGWIHDLSLHDPLYVTPVLMGVTMVWQQKIAPAAGVDPAQQKMMMFMPVVFTFMFLWAPAGVAVYWLMSNLWGIGQQYATNYMIGPPNVRSIRPPAQRQMKRAGGGKSDAAARES
jgi:YidC/Oxa1 family membrane protein insertase